MRIELAKAEDIPELCRLLEQLFTQETEFCPDHSAQRRGLEMIISNPEIGAFLVARQDQKVTGMVNLLYSVSTAQGARVALLEDMVVDPKQRGTGIGSQLLEAAITFAKQNGCRRITLLTDADNDKAQRFYQRHGFGLSPMVALRRALP